MKRWLSLLLLVSLAALLLPLALTACDGGEGDVTTPTLAPSDAPTNPATEAPTDASTEQPTAAPTEETTEAPTEPETEPPVLMPTVDLDKLTTDDAGTFVSRPSKCEVSFENDETEGKFLRMTTKSVTAVGTAKPYILLELDDMVTSMNGILPNTTEYPHVVLKVRANDLWSRSLTYFGGATIRDASNYEGFARTARVADSDGWQYVYLDLTPFTKDWKVLFFELREGRGKER